MASYLEEIHWKLNFADISPPTDPLYPAMLPVDEMQISLQELQQVIDKLKLNRASEPDEIPGEIWKCLSKDEDALNILLAHMNLYYNQAQMVKIWRKSSVVDILRRAI